MPIGTGVLLLAATAVGGGTYAVAKSKEASTGQALAAGAVAGAGTALALPILFTLIGWMLVAAIIGVPAAGVYLYLTKGKDQKALPPGRR